MIQIYLDQEKDINVLCKEVTEELKKLNLWFNANKLSLNVSKTNFILFCGKKKVDDIGILINNENIERVYSTKFLGIHIDSNLSWKQHITILKGKLSKCLYILYKCSDSLESDSLKTLYCSLFFTSAYVLLRSLGKCLWNNY